MGNGISTKTHIVEQSAELFNMRGYHACSLQDIMNATSLKKGGIYNHFKNKDEIAFAAFDHNFQKVIARVKNALESCSNSREKLNAIIDVFATFYTDPVASGGCPVFNTAVDSTNTHPQLSLKAREAINTLKKYIEIKIEEGKEAGEFSLQSKSEELSTLLILTLEGALIMSRVNNDIGPINTAVMHLKAVIKSILIN